MINCKHMLGFVLSATLLGGCTEKLHSTANAEGPQGIFKRASTHDSSETQYIVDPPDEIQVKAPNIKEIDGVKQTVRPDGKISLNLLGEVKVSGLTPGQVQKALSDAASKYYVNPDIKVEVVAASKFYNIVGRGASNQGKKPYTGNDNIIKVLTEAGVNQDAWPQQVLLVRPEREGHPAAVAVINFKKMAETGDTSQNYVIEVNDIINLRDSPLASFQFKAEQVLGPVTGSASATSSVRAAGSRSGSGY